MKHVTPMLLGALLLTLLTACGEADREPGASQQPGAATMSAAPVIATAAGLDETESSPTFTPPSSREVAKSPSAPAAANDEYATPFAAGQLTTLELADVKIATSLEEMIEESEIVFVGTIIGPREIVNQARDINDVTKEDPRIFILGQVYAVSVEQYFKGEGPDTLKVVQSEGLIFNDDKLVSLPDKQDEIEAIKARYGEKPMQAGTTYLFFVDRLQGFDPRLDYVTATAGYPTRFLLSEDGIATPESPIEGANILFNPRPVAVLLEEVESLSQES